VAGLTSHPVDLAKGTLAQEKTILVGKIMLGASCDTIIGGTHISGVGLLSLGLNRP